MDELIPVDKDILIADIDSKEQAHVKAPCRLIAI